MSTGLDEATCKSICGITKGTEVEWEWRAGPVVPASKEAEEQVTGTKSNVNNPGFWDNIFSNILAKIVGLVLQFVSLLTGIAAILLNGVIYFTVVKVSENYGNLGPIKEAWGVLRNIANMSFIFVLLYAGISTIIGQGKDNQRIIVSVVVVAVLMNFSLFFTRIVIDISNIFALTFYDAIAPGALNAAGGVNLTQAGLATAFTQSMDLQGLYNVSTTMTITSIITVGIMGSIMLMIAAFSFLAVAIMFMIRYVVLILVMILSPVYFIAWALPKGTRIEEYKDQWLDALIGQAFFAPIYFLLTWIALRVLSGVMVAFGGTGRITATALNGLASGQSGTPVTMPAFLMFMNFSIVIILMIASILIAKKWADKAGGGMSKATSWVTGVAGGATFGAVGRVGRGALGRAGQAIGENERLKSAATKGGFGGATARLALERSRKVGESSFDIRATGFGGQLGAGKAGGKGGFVDYRKKKAEDEEKFAKTLGPSDKTTRKAELELAAAKNIDHTTKEFGDEHKQAIADQRKIAEEKRADLNKKEEQYRDYAESPHVGTLEEIERRRKEIEKARTETAEADRQARQILSREGYKAAQVAEAQERVDRLKGADDKRAKEMAREKGKPNDAEVIAAIKKEYQSTADVRKQKFADSVETSRLAKIGGYNYAAATKIRKGKSPKDELAEAYKKIAKSEETEGETPAATSPTTPETPATPPPSNPTTTP